MVKNAILLPFVLPRLTIVVATLFTFAAMHMFLPVFPFNTRPTIFPMIRLGLSSRKINS